MNKPIRTISIFCMLLFLALMINASYLQFVKADDLDDDPRNRRVIEAAYSRERGAILVGRTPIASSKPSDDRYQFLRDYPSPRAYAPVTGFFSFYSQTGIEQTQNAVLSGDDPRLFVRKLVDLFSNEATKGGSVELSLDPEAQQAAFEGLSALGEGVEGAVVAIEPSTGRILAMVSLPTYDPNLLASHDLDSVTAAYDRLSNDPTEPLLNRAIQRTLPPGSTFKLVTAAAALSSNRYDATSQVPGGDTYQLPLTSGDSGLIDNEGRDCGSGDIPFAQAMGNSCNTTFAALAVEVGAEAMLEQSEAFGFNSDYLEDLRPQAESVYPSDPDEAQVGQTGIGQFEVRATPLQMAMVAAGIANEGTVMRPFLVDEVRSADYDGQRTDPQALTTDAVSPEVAQGLTDLLVATVDDGTASAAAIPGVSVAGKTGTAQRGVEGAPPYGWFVSFAPAVNADVAVAVMIEEAPGREIAGGALGGPIAKAVMEAVLR